MAIMRVLSYFQTNILDETYQFRGKVKLVQVLQDLLL